MKVPSRGTRALLLAFVLAAPPIAAQRTWRFGPTFGAGPAENSDPIYNGRSQQLGLSLALAFDTTERWGLRLELLDQRTRRGGLPSYVSPRGYEPGALLHVVHSFRPGSSLRPTLALGGGTMQSNLDRTSESHYAWSAGVGLTYTRFRIQPSLEWRRLMIADGGGTSYRPLVLSVRF